MDIASRPLRERGRQGMRLWATGYTARPSTAELVEE
jgi:hypothetical protein